MRYAVIDLKTRKVVNVIEAPEGWEVPGCVLVSSDQGSEGDRWDGRKFIRAPRPVKEPTLREQYEAAGTDRDRHNVVARALGLRD